MKFTYRSKRVIRLFFLFLMLQANLLSTETLNDKIQTLHRSFTNLKDKLIMLHKQLEEINKNLTPKSSTNSYDNLHAVNTEHLEQLALDLKYYKTNNTQFHAGHLYEHSMWTAMVIDRWFEERDKNAVDSGEKASDWLDGITSEDRSTLVLAGFLHDVGKAANHNHYYQMTAGNAQLNTSTPHLKRYPVYHTIITHPDDGFKFLKMITPYNLSVIKKASRSYKDNFKNKGRFYFDRMFQELGLSDEQIKIIQILTKVHWNFGGYLMIGSNPSQFLLELKKSIEEVDYNNKMIDLRILLLAIAIGAADVRGAQPEPRENFEDFKNRHTWFQANVFEYPTEHKQYTAAKKFVLFNYTTRGLTQRNLLLSFFKKNQSFARLSNRNETFYNCTPPFLYSSTILTDCYQTLNPGCC